MHAILSTPLPYKQCQERLTAVLDQSWSLAQLKRPVYGTCSGSTFRLYKRDFLSFGQQSIPFSSDPYRPFLEVQLFEQAAGTQIRCATHMLPFMAIMSIMWFVGLFIIGGSLMFLYLWNIFNDTTTATQGLLWLGVSIPPVIGVLGWLRIASAQAGGRRDTLYLMDFLYQLVDADYVEQYL